MQVSVSEINNKKACNRKWLLASRNGYYLKNRVAPVYFQTGHVFHESLHSLYMGVNIEKIFDYINREGGEDIIPLTTMLKGYNNEIIERDLERYEVLDIEYAFTLTPHYSDGSPVDDIEIIGFIDMVCVDKDENEIVGFEHKSCKSFKSEFTLKMDAQPRLYHIALDDFVAKYNVEHGTNYTNGGVIMNQVKKLLRDFKMQRDQCRYDDDDLAQFMDAFIAECTSCKSAINSPCHPQPSDMGCAMCSYKSVCAKYGYAQIQKEKVAMELSDEFVAKVVGDPDTESYADSPRGHVEVKEDVADE